MSYGRCVTCEAPGVIREPPPGGNTTCENGHTHKSVSFERHEQAYIHNNEFGLTKPGNFPAYINLRPRGTNQGYTLTVRSEPAGYRGAGPQAFIYLNLQDLADLRDELNRILP